MPARLRRQRRVGHLRAAQVEHAGGQVAIAPRRRHVVVILEHGGAEFVVVRVFAFQEHQRPRRVDEPLGAGILPGIGQRLAGRLQPVAADVGKDLFDRLLARPGRKGSSASSWMSASEPPRRSTASRNSGTNAAFCNSSIRRVSSLSLAS